MEHISKSDQHIDINTVQITGLYKLSDVVESNFLSVPRL